MYFYSKNHLLRRLWQETCFELFIQGESEETGYVELNLSPSEQWAAYDFAAYRAGMENRDMPRDPDCTLRVGGRMMIFDASVPLATLPPLPWRAGISAVLAEANEEDEVVKSFWALRHPPGRPDFHAPACFAARLAAPQGAGSSGSTACWRIQPCARRWTAAALPLSPIRRA